MVVGQSWCAQPVLNYSHRHFPLRELPARQPKLQLNVTAGALCCFTQLDTLTAIRVLPKGPRHTKNTTRSKSGLGGPAAILSLHIARCLQR